MKFLHAADIHLDSPMAGLAHRDAALAELMAGCTRKALSNLVDLAIAHEAAFVLIAGDLYDRDWKDYETGLFFAAEMRRLARPCFVIHGNHDAASIITRSLQLPDNVSVFSSRKAETMLLAEHRVAVHGRSFPDRAVPEDLAATYPAPVAGLFNIGLLHSSVEDPGDHATYAPCSIEALANKGYDYWALGHVHTRATLLARPCIHFPGNPQGRHVKETGSRGVTIVDVAEDGTIDTAHHATDVLRWAVAAVDASGAEDMADISVRVQFALTQARQHAEGRPLVVRVVLNGPTALHATLLGDPEQLRAECRNAAGAVADDLHIERVRTATRPATAEPTDLAALEEAFHASLAEPGLANALMADFRALAGAMPPGAAVDLPGTPAELDALRDQAWQIARHVLGQGDGR